MVAAASFAAGCAVKVASGQGTGVDAAQLQRQLNVEDAELRQAFFSSTPIAERLLVDYGGTFRYAFNIIQTPQSQNQLLNVFDLRLFTRVELDGGHRFFGRLRFQYNAWDYLSTRGLGVDSTEADWQDPIGEIYWYEFDYAGLMAAQSGQRPDFNVNMKVGRQYVIWGQGLTLSTYMYALMGEVSAGAWKLGALYGVTAGFDTVDWDLSRPGFDTDTNRMYWGARLEYSGFSGHRPYVYMLGQSDGNAGQVANLPPGLGTFPTQFNYRSYYAGLGSTGSLGTNFIYRGEAVYEWGATETDPVDRNDPTLAVPQEMAGVSAFAGLAGLTWLARDTGDTRIDVQAVIGSGDDNRLDAGNTFGGIPPGRTDHAFNSLGYVNTGLVLAPEITNLFCPSIGVSTTPLPGVASLRQLRVGATMFGFFKVDGSAPISTLTTPGTNLVGSEIDLSVEWRLLSDLDVNLRYGAFIPNQAAFAGLNNQDNIRQFLYVGVTYAF